MAFDTQQDYRFERKFFVEHLDEHEMISLLKFHPAMFKEIFPPRFINNLYLEDPLVSSYHDNVDGLTERRKIRIRWYGDLLRLVDNPILEFKIKQGLAGKKLQYPFPAFTLDNSFTEKYYRTLVRGSDLPPDVKSCLASQEPVLLNRYYRWYFATPDLRFRVTIDTGLSFYHLNKYHNHFNNKQIDHENIVVELKYQSEDDIEGNQISSRFPFRMTRSSKYVQGIERVYL